MLAGAYTAFACESVLNQPTILPQLPLLFAVWALCKCRPAMAIGTSAAIGLGCDLLAVGPLGPVMISATAVAFVAKAIHDRGEPSSLAALAILTAAFVTAVLTLEVCVSGAVLRTPVDVQSTLLMAGSRGATSAFVGVAAMLGARSLRLLQRVATAL